MITAFYLTVTLLILAGLILVISHVVSSYRRYRGPRIITCPENQRPEIVEVDAAHATLTAMVGLTDIRLEQCSRWPLMRECGQECLVELDNGRSEDLVNGVLMRWYSGKRCVYCGKEFEALNWLDDKPALQSPEGKLLQWHEIPREGLTEVINEYSPVCWNCYLVQFFHRKYPGMVYQPGRSTRESRTSISAQS